MKIKIILLLVSTLILSICIYIYKFDYIEFVCTGNKNEDIFLLNYILKGKLKSEVYKHNNNIHINGNDYRRVYLKKPILRITNPILNDEYDYKNDGCEKIDNMDIYCVVDFYKTEKGELEISYNFYE